MGGLENKTARNGAVRREERAAQQARIVIADEHYSVRDGTKFMLSGEDDIRVVGEAASGQEALELCRREHPELVLMDVRMPQMNGLTARDQATVPRHQRAGANCARNPQLPVGGD